MWLRLAVVAKARAALRGEIKNPDEVLKAFDDFPGVRDAAADDLAHQTQHFVTDADIGARDPGFDAWYRQHIEALIRAAEGGRAP